MKEYYIGTKLVSKDEWSNYFRDNQDIKVVIKPNIKVKDYDPELDGLPPISPERAKEVRSQTLFNSKIIK